MTSILSTDDIQQIINEIIAKGVVNGEIISQKDFDTDELDNYMYYKSDDQIIYSIAEKLKKANIPIQYPKELYEIGQLILVLLNT